MKKKTFLSIFVSTILLLPALGTLPTTTVRASTTHHVYPGQSIQEAINSAQPGDTIFVHNGTYYENVVVNKTVWLIGENREKTIIDGNGNGTVLYVFAHNVNISRFTVRNSGHWPFDGGIYLNNSQGCSIDGNKIDVEGSGILVSGGSGNRLMSNRIGPAYSWYGIYLINSSGNVIVGNVQSTSDVGIKLEKGSCGNNISSNHITGNIAGNIFLDSGSDNNSITNNELYAVFPTIYNIQLRSSDGNAIYHNNLYSHKQVFVDNPNNIWDNGYPNGGNYWNDYNGKDFYSGPYQNETGRDGIGDTPYIIDENNTDRYPLIYPHGYVPDPDINDDGIVDIEDIVTCAVAFGTKPGYPRWNPIVDLNQDGVIDIVDIVMIAISFGKRW